VSGLPIDAHPLSIPLALATMASSPYYSSAGYYSEPATYAQSYDPSYYPQAPAVSLPANTGHGAPQDYRGCFAFHCQQPSPKHVFQREASRCQRLI